MRVRRICGTAITLLALFLSACEQLEQVEPIGRLICYHETAGIYFNNDGTAYIASELVYAGNPKLWKVDLAKREIIQTFDIKPEHPKEIQPNRNTTPSEIWELASREYYLRLTWSNKAFADRGVQKELVSRGGTRYLFLRKPDTFRMDVVKNGVQTNLLLKEPTSEVTSFAGSATLVSPDKLYVAIGASNYREKEPEHALEPKGSELYVISADSAQILSRFPLWSDVYDGGDVIAQGPDGLVYIYNQFNTGGKNVVLVVDPKNDSIVGRIRLC